jgi:ubiquinone/menaquinone biosynthesis C-methylase UbiE
MIQSILHRIVANPQVYDFVQFAVGGQVVDKHIADRLRKLQAPQMVVDIGGGTGAMQELFSPDAMYICLDIDPLKLRGYRNKHSQSRAILGDATAAPVKSGSADLVVCKFLAHHIPDDNVGTLLKECYRMLKPDGTLLFVEPLRNDRRLRSRLLWKYDRGSFPRTLEEVRRMVEKGGRIVEGDSFACIHQYIIYLAKPSEARAHP